MKRNVLKLFNLLDLRSRSCLSWKAEVMLNASADLMKLIMGAWMSVTHMSVLVQRVVGELELEEGY